MSLSTGSAAEAVVPPAKGRHAAPMPPEELDDRALLRGELQLAQAEFDAFRREVALEEERVRIDTRRLVLTELLDVVDDIVRARKQPSVDEEYRYVTDQLTRELEEMGLERFGRQGDPFDDALHEPVGEVSGDSLIAVPTCKVVKRVGYAMGDEVLRRAQVVVAMPSHPGALFSSPSA